MNKQATILGAIAGDTIGSVYEFNPTKDYNFKLLTPQMAPTDDSLMTIAIAKWLLDDSQMQEECLARTLRHIGRTYPCPLGGYGGMFKEWLSSDIGPYNSWGNGSAMRVSACGWYFDTLEETLEAAKRSAEVTHNHPEGIKGAQATAAAIFLARTGKSKDEIKEYIQTTFGYDLSRNYDEIKRTYHFKGSCQETVPESIIAFLESNDYVEAVRLTIALGGDADTMGAITGAIASAYYGGIPEEIYDFVLPRIPDDLREITLQFENAIESKRNN